MPRWFFTSSLTAWSVSVAAVRGGLTRTRITADTAEGSHGRRDDICREEVAMNIADFVNRGGDQVMDEVKASAAATASLRDAIGYAHVQWEGRYYVVVYRGIEYARFKPQDDSNATDFCNGFNSGLNAGRSKL